MIEIPSDEVYAWLEDNRLRFQVKSQKTHINEKSITGLTQIKTDIDWDVIYREFGRDRVTKYKERQYCFTVYFDGNKRNFSYLSQEVAQSWYNFILGYLRKN